MPLIVSLVGSASAVACAATHVDLPVTYTQTSDRYPVLYVRGTSPMQEAALHSQEPVIVVILAETVRAEQLRDTVKPCIDRIYRTLSDKDNTGLVGAGSLARDSILAALNYPDTFGFTAAISPTLNLTSTDALVQRAWESAAHGQAFVLRASPDDERNVDDGVIRAVLTAGLGAALKQAGARVGYLEGLGGTVQAWADALPFMTRTFVVYSSSMRGLPVVLRP